MFDKIKITVAFFIAFMMLVIGASYKEKVDNDIVIENVSSSPGFYIDEKTETKKIKVNVQGEIKEMDMEEYLISVVAGEVYPSYNIEALKAQAVAARTYLIYKMEKAAAVTGEIYAQKVRTVRLINQMKKCIQVGERNTMNTIIK